MRLADLDPRWLLNDAGERIGFIFISPTLSARTRSDGTRDPFRWRQTCFVAPTSFEEQERAVWAAMQDLADEDGEFYGWQACNQGCGWSLADGIANATFEAMSVTPSIDGSAGGLWHGFITNGDVVGGI